MGPEDWGRLAEGTGLYQSYPWLHWAESSSGARPEYVLAHGGDGVLVGAVPTYLLSSAPDRFTTWYDPVRVFLAPHCDTTDATDRWFPLLLVGSASGYHSEILVRPGRDRRAVARALLSGCLDLAGRSAARGTAMMYAPEAAALEAGAVLGGPVAPVPTSAEAVIPVTAEDRDLDDYLARFPSARRSKFKKEITAFRAAGGTTTRYALGDLVDRVGPLLGQLQRRYGDPVTDHEMTAYVASQERHLGAWSVVLADETDDGGLRGFTLSYIHENTLYVRAAGFQEDLEQPPFAYFNLAVYAPLRLAMENGLTAVDLGTGAYRGKTLRGAAIQPLWSAVRPPGDCPPQWYEALGQPAPEAVEAGWAGTRK
ncbi:peptidogalycan biosysnthesis protein [Streptomyces sp. NPDC058405]|uniref:peptidogalycan biosysnthesis protein n=1 Tax=Streptomyces sp. NPDC058405 TaxID=3346482 RepID=UPI003659C5DF